MGFGGNFIIDSGERVFKCSPRATFELVLNLVFIPTSSKQTVNIGQDQHNNRWAIQLLNEITSAKQPTQKSRRGLNDNENS